MGWEGLNGRNVGRSGEGYPLRFPNSYLGVSLFKDTTPPEGRVTPAREERGQPLTAALPAISQPRQVSLRAAPPEPLPSLK